MSVKRMRVMRVLTCTGVCVYVYRREKCEIKKKDEREGKWKEFLSGNNKYFRAHPFLVLCHNNR